MKVRREIERLARSILLVTAANVVIIGLINIFGLADKTLEVYCIALALPLTRLVAIKLRKMREVKERSKAMNLWGWALILCDGSRYEEAINVMEEGLDVCPDFSPTWETIGFAHESMGDDENAISAYREAIAVDPCNSRAHMGLSRVFRSLGLNILSNDELEYAGLEQAISIN